MRIKGLLTLLALFLFVSLPVHAGSFLIHAGALIDGVSDEPIKNGISVTVSA